MKPKKIVIILFILFSAYELFSQENEYSRSMYVNAIEGLIVRKSPNINSERIGLLPNNTIVEVITEVGNQDYVVIDDIRGKWVYIYVFSLGNGWVFDGYLKNFESYPTVENKYMYINALEGLRVRSFPDINSERINSLPHLSIVRLIKEDENYIVIDDIRGKWVYVKADFYRNEVAGWVFDGYLMDGDKYKEYLKNIDIIQKFQERNDDQKSIIGFWIQNNKCDYFRFYENRTFEWAIEAGDVGARGIWYLKDGNYYLEHKISEGNDGFAFIDKPVVYQIIFFNNNVIMLKNKSQEDHELKVYMKPIW